MKTKKILSLALAAIMTLSMGVTSLAANITTNGGSGQTLVTYGTNEGFIVTIPSEINSWDMGSAVAEISATNVMIPNGATLNVSISGHDYVGTGDDGWELIDTENPENKFTYYILNESGSKNFKNNDIVLSVASGEAYNSTVRAIINLYFNEDIVTKAGNYADTLTFTVEVDGGSVASGDITHYTQEDIDSSNNTLFAMGATNPLDVVGRIENEKLIITKNGNNSDGKIKEYTNPDIFEYEGYQDYFSPTTMYTLAIKDVEIKEGITEIGNFTFGSAMIDTLVFPESIETIEECIFYMSTVKNITIPANLKHLDERAFEFAYSIENITFEGRKAQWEELAPVLYLQNTYTVHCIDGDVVYDIGGEIVQ